MTSGMPQVWSTPAIACNPATWSFDHAVDAFLGLLRGENVGKMVVKI